MCPVPTTEDDVVSPNEPFSSRRANPRRPGVRRSWALNPPGPQSFSGRTPA